MHCITLLLKCPSEIYYDIRNRQHLWVAGDHDCDDPDGNCGKIIENMPQLKENIKHEVENNLLKRTYERLMKRTSEENFNERLMKREDFEARLMKRGSAAEAEYYSSHNRRMASIPKRYDYRIMKRSVRNGYDARLMKY